MRGRPSQSDSFGENSPFEVGTEAFLGHDFNVAPQKLLQILFEADEVQERTAMLNINEQVQIAIGPVLVPRDGTKDPDVSHAVSRRKVEDRLPLPKDPR